MSRMMMVAPELWAQMKDRLERLERDLAEACVARDHFSACAAELAVVLRNIVQRVNPQDGLGSLGRELDRARELLGPEELEP